MSAKNRSEISVRACNLIFRLCSRYLNVFISAAGIYKYDLSIIFIVACWITHVNGKPDVARDNLAFILLLKARKKNFISALL